MSRPRELIGAVLLLLSVPAGAGAQSLWRDGVSGASLFADARARAVNDIVTVLIVEQSSSSRSANTTSSKDTSRTAGVKDFPTILDPLASRLVKPLVKPLLGYSSPSQIAENKLGIDLESKAAHTGKGSIDRSDKVSGQMAARVVKVLDNGNLVIEGRRAVLVNDESEVITLSGVIRPQDIAATNTILSSQIADAEIQMVGRGILAEAQRPGILYRILDWLQLF